jgi:hypothetical protein
MDTALIIGAVLAAGLACPAIMWWQGRRQRTITDGVQPGERPSDPSAELRELRRREAVLSDRVAELQREHSEGVGTRRTAT